MNLYQNQSKNVWKTWALMLCFFALVGALGWFASYYYSDSSILYIAFGFAIFLNIFSYWFSDKIVLKLHKAKKVTREEYFDLWNITENLSITAGLPMPALYLVDDPAPNAFATGRDKEHAVVCVTTGLLSILERSELEGVIAHELSHIGNRDMLISTVAVVLVGFVSILSDIFMRSSPGGSRDRDRGSPPLMIIGLILLILAPIFATLLQLAVSRKREFLADASGALLTRYPEGLANALRKISTASGPLRTASDATAHLFIANPFGSLKASGLHKLFATHPPVGERIQALIGDNLVVEIK
jgi:heat shock protein HtpX